MEGVFIEEGSFFELTAFFSVVGKSDLMRHQVLSYLLTVIEVSDRRDRTDASNQLWRLDFHIWRLNLQIVALDDQ